jgi:ribose transport system ATP-binding protein
MPPFVEAVHVSKAFGGVQALDDVSLGFEPGEVHGLIGANGAGKSTFVRILAGVHQPDAGEIILDGQPRHVRNPLVARGLGMSFIHQELNLVPKFSVLTNLGLGLRKPTRFGMTDWRAFRAEVEPVAERLKFPFRLDAIAEDLSVADRWLVSIGHALVHKARLVAMDEPTASLSADEVDRLFDVIADLRSSGVAVIYVSHRLDEVEHLCDRVSVFRNGRLVGSLVRGEITRARLIEGIIGGPPPQAHRASGVAVERETVLRIEDVRRPPMVNGVSFTLGRGETVGLAGLVGAGRTELARILFGVDKGAEGRVVLDGREIRPGSTRDAARLGIALVPEERRTQGLLLRESVRFNLTLPSLRSFRVTPTLPYVRLEGAARASRDMVQRLDIRTPDVETTVGRLSGGNQQKVVVGKWLMRQPRVLILDEPTRGVDVGARAEIHRTIRELAAGGVPILMIASELEELLGCDRVLVMREGRVAGELAGEAITVPAMLALCYAAAA